MASDSEVRQGIFPRSQQHLGTGGTGYSGAFETLGESPIEGDGTVHTMTKKPLPDRDPWAPTGHRVLKDRVPGSGSSPPVEPSSDQ
jgi:hypothetical protein